MFDTAETIAQQAPADGSPAPREEMDELEIALHNVAQAERRLKMVVGLSDMSYNLAQVVYRRAMAEETAAVEALEAAALARHAVCEDDEPSAAALAARVSADAAAVEEAQAPARRRVRAPSAPRAPAPPRALDAATLFIRLSETVRKCLEMEAAAEETFKVMQSRVPAVRAMIIERYAHYSPGYKDAVEELYKLIWPVIAEEQRSEEDGRNLRAAVQERIRVDPAYEHLHHWPSVLVAALLCKDVGLEPNRPDWLPHGLAPPGYIRLPRPKWSPFAKPSRKPLLRSADYWLDEA